MVNTLRNVVFLVMVSTAWALPANATSDTKFDNLLDEHWQRSLQEQVFFRRDPDSFRMDGALPSYSSDARERRHQYNEDVLARLATIDSNKLSSAQNISLLVFRYERLAEQASYSQPDYLFPLTNRSNWQTYFVNAVDNMSFLTERDYRQYLLSLSDYPRYNDENLQLMAQAIKRDFTHYCASMEGYEETIAAAIVDEVELSALYRPFINMPGSMSLASQDELRVQGQHLIGEVVIPEFQKFLDFYQKQYAPQCRQMAGISSLKGGQDYYKYLVNFYTTVDMTPTEIHALGLSEVKRIRAQMFALIERVDFDGGFKDFVDFLRTDPQFYTDDPEDLMEKVSRLAKRMDGQLPRLFATLPRNTYDVKPVPAAIAERTTGAYYVPAPGDGRTPGTYFINTSLLKSRPLYVLEALSFHEAVPGHHLQNAIAQEQDIPLFRRFLNHGAYTEGWALYAERLGLEAGFYTDPYSDFGRLTYEMWRACRLVVDTGLHVFGWSRERAIDYLVGNTALSIHGATAEIDRYITWPGQALSYKIGELKIRELRAQAEQALGASFDLREFHDVVLQNGSVPLSVLRDIVENWIAENAATDSSD